MIYLDFNNKMKKNSINLLFSDWRAGERVAFFSPHDDDVVLGAGYLVLAVIKSKGLPYVFVFCRGDAGYSEIDKKEEIVKVRRIETIEAYRKIGVPEDRIYFFDIPDFSLMSYLDRINKEKRKGLFEPILHILRKEKISRVVFSSGDYEHWDHTAAFYFGLYVTPQAQDPILVDLGRPVRLKSFLAYSVWSDFEFRPEKKGLNADLGILAEREDESKIMEALRTFKSQGNIIQNIVRQRSKRKINNLYLEVYKKINLRRPIDYRPYFKVIHELLIGKS